LVVKNIDIGLRKDVIILKFIAGAFSSWWWWWNGILAAVIA
jgi:hypothetical protein